MERRWQTWKETRVLWYQRVKGKLTEANWPGGLFGFFLAKEEQNKIKMNGGLWGFSKGCCFPLGGGSAKTQRTITDVVMTNNVIL